MVARNISLRCSKKSALDRWLNFFSVMAGAYAPVFRRIDYPNNLSETTNPISGYATTKVRAPSRLMPSTPISERSRFLSQAHPSHTQSSNGMHLELMLPISKSKFALTENPGNPSRYAHPLKQVRSRALENIGPKRAYMRQHHRCAVERFLAITLQIHGIFCGQPRE